MAQKPMRAGEAQNEEDTEKIQMQQKNIYSIYTPQKVSTVPGQESQKIQPRAPRLFRQTATSRDTWDAAMVPLVAKSIIDEQATEEEEEGQRACGRCGENIGHNLYSNKWIGDGRVVMCLD
ncbi:hypothetical protein ABZP36_017595 [Zizania latifolia]